MRVVADHARRNRIIKALGLAIPDDADFFIDIVRHGNGAAQRDLFLAEAAQGRIFHVPVVIADLGI
ncbi:hypothetical protein D3C87_1912530 [compost metagenome]